METETIKPRTNPRVRLPQRREGYTQKMQVDGHSLYLRTGEYEDGSLGEIFVSLGKEGDLISSLVNSFCIVTSIALQSGTPLEVLVNNFIFTKFEPSGCVQNHPHIRIATSILDAIFRDLAIHYLGRDDLKHA
jgi:ribonucleoside-diphosphate reductase alpha chain